MTTYSPSIVANDGVTTMDNDRNTTTVAKLSIARFILWCKSAVQWRW